MGNIPRTPKMPKQDPGLEERMIELEAILKDVEESVANRDLLINLATEDPNKYDCYYWKNQWWLKWAMNEKRVFVILKKKVEAAQFSSAIQAREIDGWMQEAKALQRNTWTYSEQPEAEEEDEDPTAEAQELFKEGWSWAQEEGSGPGLDDLVDPKDTSNKTPEKVEEGVEGWKEFREVVEEI